jgi:ribosomal protein S18 acetylase RimI-like enzyme
MASLQKNSDINIKTATLQDVDIVAPLFDAYRQFYEQAADLPLATRFVRDRLEAQQSVILLAKNASGQALGFCQLYPSFCSVIAQPIAVLYDLFVAPAARQSGAGRALIQAADRYAKANGFARLDLTTAKNNTKAQDLYESEGWDRDEIFYAYSKTTKI